MIVFRIVDILPPITNDTIVYLVNNNWDDWFEFETTYSVVFQKNRERMRLGGVKIGKINQTERRPILPNEFISLSSDCFSLGTGDNYYEELKIIEEREEILIALNDIAYDLSLFEKVATEKVTRISLLRDITSTMVKGQLHRMAIGGAKLTDYDFSYSLTQVDVVSGKKLELGFKVDVNNSMPPSNIHVLIGKNGVGKTTILKNIIKALEGVGDPQIVGKVQTGWGEDFSNIVNISFSAFDMPIFPEELGEEIPIKYTYVGLIKMTDSKKSVKNSAQLAADFFERFYRIVKGAKNRLWRETIEILESDNTFSELDIKRWNEAEVDVANNSIIGIQKEEGETEAEFLQRKDKLFYKQKVGDKFEILSSGHKNILLTIVTLLDLVEEKTLVFLDEPEEHLHPPLVSAFIRALSNLLRYRNGVGIIATHSPVIVQEVPKKCVWILRRKGKYMKFERPEIETFGENLGELTSEIFGYEVMNSGFHKMLNEVAEKSDSYIEALDEFNNELGNEAKAILKSYILGKDTYD
ncbi:AAA family ATPase [Extibacter muris]|uniref:AAA family ATPase n=1 Tax=Extibacter muris TaxID=1796622 RepID=UPI001D06E45A|nr:AAA family ATPase [Extibacter muris]MCB6202024.1 AAA family ATPase [Extibacter muris]MCQ4663304.1 AAA family ATPase [Extibacter muris]MCQ4692656.1 AAA family ATPase [Extibacter muris]